MVLCIDIAEGCLPEQRMKSPPVCGDVLVSAAIEGWRCRPLMPVMGAADTSWIVAAGLRCWHTAFSG